MKKNGNSGADGRLLENRKLLLPLQRLQHIPGFLSFHDAAVSTTLSTKNRLLPCIRGVLRKRRTNIFGSAGCVVSTPKCKAFVIMYCYAYNTFSTPELERQPPTPFRCGTVPVVPVSGTSQNPYQGIRLLQLSPDPHHRQSQDSSGKRPHRRPDPGIPPRHGHQQDHPTYQFATGTKETGHLIVIFDTTCQKEHRKRCSFFVPMSICKETAQINPFAIH